MEAATLALAPGLGDGDLPDEIALRIAGFLSIVDLGRLTCVSRRFGQRSFAAPGTDAAEAEDRWGVGEEAARRRLAGCSAGERGWAPRSAGESWLCLMHAVEAHRLPLAFGRVAASSAITITEDAAVATKSARQGQRLSWRAAASTAVMRSGRHFAQFTILQGRMYLGVVRPGWDTECSNLRTVHGHCFLDYSTGNGCRLPGGHDWEGRHCIGITPHRHDRIGMLLNLDQGSMTIWKNDVKLGVMQVEGLSGPYCWAVSLFGQDDSMRIDSVPAPPPPTEEELAAAKAWQEARSPTESGVPAPAATLESVEIHHFSIKSIILYCEFLLKWPLFQQKTVL